MRILLLIVLFIHILICIAFFFLIKTKRVEIGYNLLPVICWIPLWGAMAALVAEYILRKETDNKKEIAIEQMKINEQIHKSVLRDEDSTQNITVPFEEAMLINESSVRRELLIDALYRDPEKQLKTLKDVKLDNDTEVMHYATTAMVELQREFELEVQRVEVIYRQDTSNQTILDYYIDLMERYISSELIDGSLLKILRNRYHVLLQDKYHAKKSLGIKLKIADNEIELENFMEAEQLLDEIIEEEEADERSWLLLIKLYGVTFRFKEISTVIGRMEEKNIYLSPKGKEMIKFWTSK